MYIPRNSSPINNKLGIQDVSIPELVRTAVGDPIHKPLIFTFSPIGVEDEAFPLVGDNLFSLLGRQVLDYRSDYATFNTPFQALFNTLGNECLYQRVCSDDAKAAADRLRAEVVITKVPKYVRNALGEVERDAVTGKPKVDGEVTGPLIVWRHGGIEKEAGEFGVGNVVDGTILGEGGAKSKLYPIFDRKAPYRGKACNGYGWKITPLHRKSSPAITAEYQQEVGGRIYDFQFFEQIQGIDRPVIMKSISGMSSIRASLKTGAYYRPLRQDLEFETIVPDAYRKTDPEINQLPHYGPFEEIHFYRENFEAILQMMADAIPDWEGDIWMLDPFTGLDIHGNPYDGVTVNPNTENGKVNFGDGTILYMQDGVDGEMGNDAYDKLVRQEMLMFGVGGKVRYDNELKYSLGCFWDSGFSFDTKEAMVNFIGRSRNTYLFATSFVYNQDVNDLQAEEAAKVALFEIVTSVPESDLYGTPAARATISGQAHRLRNSTYKKYVPLNYSLAGLFSKCYGAKDGYPKNEFAFGRGEKTILDGVSNLTLPWKGNEVYASDWDVNFVSARSFDYYRAFIPAIITVYNNKSSSLISARSVFEMTYVFRRSDRAWANWVGTDDMTGAELCKNVENELIQDLTGRLTNALRCVPRAYQTEEDVADGFAIHLDFDTYNNPAFTQMNTTIRAHRADSSAEG